MQHKPVEVVGYEARDVLVKGGVADGEWVVALGTQKLDTAQKVRVVDKSAVLTLRRDWPAKPKVVLPWSEAG